MSGKMRRKKDGRRKDKRLGMMRAGELRRHLESGVGYSASRGAPHLGHTAHQQGQPLSKPRPAVGPQRDHPSVAGRNWLAPSARSRRR